MRLLARHLADNVAHKPTAIVQGSVRTSLIRRRAPPSNHQRRTIRLARPPYLLDEPYTPRYALLSSVDAAKKRSAAYAHLRNCNLCPRRCSVNRLERAGACLIPGNTVRCATIAPHRGEEPCIQGAHGSGAVFFSGCSLRCVFCQNHDVAHTSAGMEVSPEELAEWMLKLQDVGGCHNINLVTPEHVVPQVVLALLAARDAGLSVPVVYNTSAYDSLESLALLDGLVDVYMPDFKVWEPATSKRLLKAEDYAVAARESIKAMHTQVGDLAFTSDGLAKKGLLVRHLVMPGLEDEGKTIMQWLATELGTETVVHVMEQYHPRAHVGKGRRTTSKSRTGVIEPGGVQASPDVVKEIRYSEINRPVKDEEVLSVRKAAEAAGLWRFIDVEESGAFYA